MDNSKGAVQGDMWKDMWECWKRYSEECLPFDSEEIKGWWSKVQESSSIIIDRVLTLTEWQYFMKLLGHADVSGIENLKVSGDIGLDSSFFLALALKSRLLPNIVSLSFVGWKLGHAVQAALVDNPWIWFNALEDLSLSRFNSLQDLSLSWFNSLEDLSLSDCGISANAVSAMVDTIMKAPKRGLAMKDLNLKGNYMGNPVVDALVSLITSDRLPHLEALDLSQNRLHEDALARLMETIQSGHLPSLKKLDWLGNWGVNDEVAESIAKAYLENGALTAEIRIDWSDVTDRSLEAKVEVYRERNERLLRLRKKLEEELKDVVPLNSAKVFLCGYPKVGKTTLRRSLERPLGLIGQTLPELLKEPRTKGIELSRIQVNDTTLILWDLAGQEEFHVLHGTFFADLGLESGKATTFVLVLKPPFEKRMEDDLKYWLKFIASGSSKHVKRHVVIVLNCFGGNQCTEPKKQELRNLTQEYASNPRLSGLDIHLEPFINDVRVAEFAQRLKHCLSKQAQTLLQGVQVPKACFDLLVELKRWSNDENKAQRPIFSWQAFEDGWKKKREFEEDFPTEHLRTYATYLHEIGEIIYFQRKDSTDPGSGNGSIVVPDPEWFCRQVVGQLLLPKSMVEGDEFFEVHNDGSISLSQFRAYFEHLLPHDSQSDDVISLLEQMGLCYKSRDEKESRDTIIVPALITDDNFTLTGWDGKGSHGVMGRSLATADKDWSAIPGMLFRRLQVQLAQHEDFGGRGDSDYRAGKCSSTFKVGAHLVLIQFNEDPSDPSDDRIDILVTSCLDGNSTDVSLAQVNCICKIMQIVEKLCARWCPGLKYNVKAIRPWNATQGTPKMTKRKLISLTEIKARLTKGEEYSSWELSGSCVKLQTFLSTSELREVFGRSERVYAECKQDVVILGFLTEDALKQIEACEEEHSHKVRSPNMQSTSITSDGRDDNEVLTRAVFEQRMKAFYKQLKKDILVESSLTRQHIDQKFIELLGEIQHKHRHLVRHIQELQTFSIEEKERSVPRYIFLSRRPDKKNVWIKLKSVVEYRFELHLLCEAHYKTGLLHEVKGQAGIKLTRQKDWVVKISPWVRNSLQVAVMVGKAVGNFYLPGIFGLINSLIPDLDFGEGVPTIVDKAATILLDEDKRVSPAQLDYGTAAEPVDVKARKIAEAVVKELKNEVREIEFTRKIELRKMWLEDAPHLYRGVRWVCNPCSENYILDNPKNKVIE